MTPDPYSHWHSKTIPMVGHGLLIPFSVHFSEEDLERAAAGLLPQSMDDKWMGFLESDAINFYRSWTGHQIYHLPIERQCSSGTAGPLFVVDNPSVYRRQGDAQDLRIIESLLHRLIK